MNVTVSRSAPPPRRRSASAAWTSLVFFGGITLLGATAACYRCARSTAHQRAVAPERLEPIAVGPHELRVAPATGRPRLLLDDQTLGRLRESARARTETFRRLEAHCIELAKKPVKSGYQGWDWAGAVANLSVCWHATGNENYARAAVGYLDALLDDRFVVGDGKGGDEVVHFDSGYGIRTFGAYSALGYDWLRKAPDMTPERRKKTLDRLTNWLGWYAEHGYLHDDPIANYFWGYLSTLVFAGLAAHGETPQAGRWLELSRTELLGHKVLPTFRSKLGGGYWPEGWQYGEYTAAEIALVAKAFQTAAGVDLARQIPWLGDAVQYHVHALLPDESSVYDGGTWGQKPAQPSSLAMSAIAYALDGIDARRSAEARFIARATRVVPEREYWWIAALGDWPGAPMKNPLEGQPLAFHAPGAGLSFVRSDWSRSAVWASFQAGPRLAPDHQENDQGHFEIWRGSDGLLVDGGSGEGSATINHNTILVDDGGKIMNYTPNQGVWGQKVRTTAFGDDGVASVAVGEIGEAYAPKCAEDGCSKRAVDRLTRTFVFVRPSILVVADRVLLHDEDFGAVWAAHSTVEPRVASGTTSAVVGRSRVDIVTIEPSGAVARVLREPTPSGEGPHRADLPWGPMWRIEIDSPRGEKERHFIELISVDDARAPVARAVRLSGSGLRGARGTVAGAGTAKARNVAVLVADGDQGGRAELGAPADDVVVAGLTANAKYDVRIGGDCSLEVRPGGGGRLTNSAGFLRVRVEHCGGR